MKMLITELCPAHQQRQAGVVLIIFIVVIHLTTILGALSKKEEALRTRWASESLAAPTPSIAAPTPCWLKKGDSRYYPDVIVTTVRLCL